MSKMSHMYRKYCKEIDLEKDKLKKAKLHDIVNTFAKFKKGDIIDNGGTRIKVDRIAPWSVFDKVDIVYIGVKFTKKNTPFKNNEIGSVYTDENHERIELIKVD